MGKIGAIWKRQRFVQLAVRATEPSLGNRSVCIKCPLESEFLEIGPKRTQYYEQVGILCR